jgi:hypothetical protein
MQVWALDRGISLEEGSKYGCPGRDHSVPCKLRENPAIGDHFFLQPWCSRCAQETEGYERPAFSPFAASVRGRRTASLEGYSKISRKRGGVQNLSSITRSRRREVLLHQCAAQQWDFGNLCGLLSIRSLFFGSGHCRTRRGDLVITIFNG